MPNTVSSTCCFTSTYLTSRLCFFACSSTDIFASFIFTSSSCCLTNVSADPFTSSNFFSNSLSLENFSAFSFASCTFLSNSFLVAKSAASFLASSTFFSISFFAANSVTPLDSLVAASVTFLLNVPILITVVFFSFLNFRFDSFVFQIYDTMLQYFYECDIVIGKIENKNIAYRETK